MELPIIIAGRDVVPNVPDLFGGGDVLPARADSAQGCCSIVPSPVILHSHVARKTNGTLRTASLPVIGWRVDTNMPKGDCLDRT
jgi:hypothetical protein